MLSLLHCDITFLGKQYKNRNKLKAEKNEKSKTIKKSSFQCSSERKQRKPQKRDWKQQYNIINYNCLLVQKEKMLQDKDLLRNSWKKASSSTFAIETDLVDKNRIKKQLQKEKQKNKNQLKKAMSQGATPATSHSIKKQLLQLNSNMHSDGNKYRLMMSNISEKNNTFFFCTFHPAKQSIIAYLHQQKQLQIKNQKDTETMYYFNFNTINAQIQKHDSITNQFILKICDDIVLKFENDKNYQILKKFQKQLQKIVKQSMGKKYCMESLKTQQNFYKKKYKSAVQFTDECQTGDIVLFRGKEFGDKIQRFITNSQYDHVGMIYKDASFGGVYILQSSSQPGTRFSKWEFILKYKWYTSMEKLVWRKLEGIQKDSSFRKKMYNLMVNNIGKQYHISLDKLFSNQSYIYTNSPSAILQEKQKNKFLKPSSRIQQQSELQSVSTLKVEKKKGVGFFCSQLIAVVYKDMNFLTRDSSDKYFKPSCNYLPYHFSQKFDLHLLQGHLSEEITIHFNDNEIADSCKFGEI